MEGAACRPCSDRLLHPPELASPLPSPVIPAQLRTPAPTPHDIDTAETSPTLPAWTSRHLLFPHERGFSQSSWPVHTWPWHGGPSGLTPRV